jgi:hypothetical protein
LKLQNRFLDKNLLVDGHNLHYIETGNAQKPVDFFCTRDRQEVGMLLRIFTGHHLVEEIPYDCY